MRDYRVYFLSKEGRIQKAADLKADDDAAALEAAKRLGDGRPIELWEGARVVSKLVPTPAG